jgi:hypothetical protein
VDAAPYHRLHVVSNANDRRSSPPLPRARSRSKRLDLAVLRPRAGGLPLRRRSLRRRSAPRSRRRRRGRNACGGAQGRGGLLRGVRAHERVERDDRDGRRPVGHPRPPRLDRRCPRGAGRRGPGGGRDRPVRYARAGRPLRAPRCPHDVRSERLPGSARVPAGPRRRDARQASVACAHCGRSCPEPADDRSSRSSSRSRSCTVCNSCTGDRERSGGAHAGRRGAGCARARDAGAEPRDGSGRRSPGGGVELRATLRRDGRRWCACGANHRTGVAHDASRARPQLASPPAGAEGRRRRHRARPRDRRDRARPAGAADRRCE